MAVACMDWKKRLLRSSFDFASVTSFKFHRILKSFEKMKLAATTPFLALLSYTLAQSSTVGLYSLQTTIPWVPGPASSVDQSAVYNDTYYLIEQVPGSAHSVAFVVRLINLASRSTSYSSRTTVKSHLLEVT